MTTQHTPYDAQIAQLEQAHGQTADTMGLLHGLVVAERRGYLAAKAEDADLLAAAEAMMVGRSRWNATGAALHAAIAKAKGVE
jgi:hypothetical protein